MRKQGDGYVIRSEESITLMTPYRFPHYDAFSSNRHSERRQECLMEKTENEYVTWSEESMTLMTSYGFPHHGNRSFTFVQDDVLWSSSSRQ